MNKAMIKLQIGSLEQQIKALKSKISTGEEKKTLADLYGMCKGKMDLSFDEIKKHEYSYKG